MIQVELHDRANGLVKILSGAKNAAYHQVLNSDGSGTFLINRADPDVGGLGILTGGIDGYIVHLLRKGPLETAFTDRFAFVAETMALGIGQQEDAGAWIRVSGRGTLCLLEDRVAYPPGFDGLTAASILNQWQIYVTTPAGAIMAGEIDRSNPRFAVKLTHSTDSGTPYSQPVLADAPSSWWRLDDVMATPLTAKDLGSANKPGTINGGVTLGVPGALSPDPDTAMTFDGTTGYIQAGLPQTGATAWSLEAWINPKAFSGTANMGVIGVGATSTGYGLHVGNSANSGGTHLMAAFFGVGDLDSGYAFPSAKRWYHVVITYDNVNLRFYVNGALQATVAHSAPIVPTGNAFIGCDTTGAARFFNGSIDEVAIYPTTLSLARIQAHYSAGSSYYQPVSKTTIPQTVKLRFDNLRLLHDALASSGPMEGQMVGLDYQAFNQIGSDKSASVTVQMAPQDSLLEAALERDSRPVKNWVVAQGTGEGLNTLLAVSSDTPSIASLRRREGFQDARSVDSQSQLNLTAAGAINQFKAVDQRITTRFFDSTHTQLYRDFGLGDTIVLAVQPVNFSSKYRVMGISIADVDAEHEECALDLNDMRAEYLVKLLKGVVGPAIGSLAVLNRFPQGATFNDSFGFPDSADASHPWRVKRFIPSNVLQLNSCKLSFSLGAFRADVAGANTVTSDTTPLGHTHHWDLFGGGTGIDPISWNLQVSKSSAGAVQIGTSDIDTGGGSHAHGVTPTLNYGIFEGTTATNIKVLINGIDRTVALGALAAGFTADQTELEISQWLNIGAWNTFELQPSNLGRIFGDIRMTGYVQSA